jgi:hypothetical protein
MPRFQNWISVMFLFNLISSVVSYDVALCETIPSEISRGGVLSITYCPTHCFPVPLSRLRQTTLIASQIVPCGKLHHMDNRLQGPLR